MPRLFPLLRSLLHLAVASSQIPYSPKPMLLLHVPVKLALDKLCENLDPELPGTVWGPGVLILKKQRQLLKK